MRRMAGAAAAVGNLASAIAVRAEEASIVAELKTGSEEAYNWLIAHYHQPIYSLVYRILTDPTDAADTTQEVFLKVFRGMKRFNGECSLKTWLYRIAIHEASNQRRWWFRHKSKETSMEARVDQEGNSFGLCDTLADQRQSPLEVFAHEEVRARVELETQNIYLATFLKPVLAQEALYPKRFWLWSVVAFLSLLLWGGGVGTAVLVRNNLPA